MALFDPLYFDTSVSSDPLDFMNPDHLLGPMYPINDGVPEAYDFNSNTDLNLDFWSVPTTTNLVDPRQTFNASLPRDPTPDFSLFSQQLISCPVPFQSTTISAPQPVGPASESSRPTRKRRISTDDAPSEHDSAKPAPKKRRSRKRKPLPTPAEAEVKRQNFLRRNRAAAAKCRQKNRVKVNAIQEKKNALDTQHKILILELSEVREQVDCLRKLILTHADCNHPEIMKWLEKGGDLGPLAPQRPALDVKMFQNPAEPTEEDGDRSGRSGSADSAGEEHASENDTTSIHHQQPSISSVMSSSPSSHEEDKRQGSPLIRKRKLPSPPDSAIDVHSPQNRAPEAAGIVPQRDSMLLVEFEALDKDFLETQQFSRPVL